MELRNINKLPAIPQVLTKLLKAFQDENLSVTRLASIIETDGVLSLKLIAAANSPYYRRNSQILSVKESVLSIGWEGVKTLALGAAMYQVLHEFTARNQFNLASYWRHTLTCASLSRKIAGYDSKTSPDEAYLAGLMHDIGRLAMLMAYAQQYVPFFEGPENDPAALRDEVERFGTSHCEVGASIIQDWDIKSFLEDAIAFHHKPAEQLQHASALVKVVHLANRVAESGQSISQAVVDEARQWFNIEFEALYQLRMKCEADVQAMATALGIDIGAAPTRQASLETWVESAQQEASRELVRTVATQTLIEHIESAVGLHKDERSFLTALQQTAWLLCGARQVLFFVADSSGGHVGGKAFYPGQEWVEQFSFPLSSGAGLVSDALNWNCMTHSFEATKTPLPSLADQQIVRQCGTDGILCVPMANETALFGTLVFALNRDSACDQVAHPFLSQSLARVAGMFLESLASGKASPATSEEEAPQHPDLRRFVHETSNPLSTIRNYLQVHARKIAGKGVESDELRIVNEEIDRISRMIGELANPQVVAESVETDINQSIRDVAILYQDTMLRPSGIRVTLRLAPDILPVVTEPFKLRQVLGNLVRNAAEAMNGGGHLTLSTACETFPGRGKQLVIRVADTGPGIDESVRDKLLQAPVQTTKGGSHAGIGLSIVADMVRALGGKITFDSIKGEGTTFEIRLPYRVGDASRGESASAR